MPETDEEWQSAVDWAELLLDIYRVSEHHADQINTTRCQEILIQGAARGFTPTVQNELITEYLELE